MVPVGMRDDHRVDPPAALLDEIRRDTGHEGGGVGGVGSRAAIDQHAERVARRAGDRQQEAIPQPNAVQAGTGARAT